MNRRLFAIVVLAVVLFSTLGLDRQTASAQAAADSIAVSSNCSSTVTATGYLNDEGGWVDLYVGGVYVTGSSIGGGTFSVSFSVSIVPPTEIRVDLYNGREALVAQASMTCGGSTGFLPECGGTLVQKLGTVAISPAQSQPAYDTPNGNRVLIDGKPVMLPGSPVTGREFTVIDKKTVGGKLWLGLWIGACVPVWVPASGVTLLTSIA